jgi:hypothetical protein
MTRQVDQHLAPDNVQKQKPQNNQKQSKLQQLVPLANSQHDFEGNVLTQEQTF